MFSTFSCRGNRAIPAAVYMRGACYIIPQTRSQYSDAVCGLVRRSNYFSAVW